MHVAVVGAGSWGTTVASLCASNADVVLWARRQEVADEVREEHRNSRYLQDFDLPPSLRSTCDMAEAVGGADVVVVGVPSHGFRAAVAEAAPHITAGTPIVSLSKGVEQST